MPAPSFVSSSTATNPTNAATFLVPCPTTPTQGNMLVAFQAASSYAIYGTTTVTPPSGWNLLTRTIAFSGGYPFYVFWKLCGASEPANYTFNGSPVYGDAVTVFNISGEYNSPEGFKLTFAAGGSSTAVSGNYSTALANEFIIGCVIAQAAGVSLSNLSGLTAIGQVGSPPTTPVMNSGYTTQASAGAVATFTSSLGNANAWVAIVMSIAPIGVSTGAVLGTGLSRGVAGYKQTNSGNILGLGLPHGSPGLKVASGAIVGLGLAKGLSAAKTVPSGAVVGLGLALGLVKATSVASASGKVLGLVLARGKSITNVARSASGKVVGLGLARGRPKLNVSYSGGILGLGLTKANGGYPISRTAKVVGLGLPRGRSRINTLMLAKMIGLGVAQGTPHILIHPKGKVLGTGLTAGAAGAIVKYKPKVLGLGLSGGLSAALKKATAEELSLGLSKGKSGRIATANGGILGLGIVTFRYGIWWLPYTINLVGDNPPTIFLTGTTTNE